MRRSLHRFTVYPLMLVAAVVGGHAFEAAAQSKKAPRGFDQHKKEVEAGKMHTVQYDSKTVGVRRKMVVYTPPGYSKPSKYPVLYLMHGLGGDHTDWRKNEAGVILDNLYAHKKVVPMLVVMPDNRAGANSKAGTDKKQEFAEYALFERDLLDDVIPFVESHYSTVDGPDGRALAGLSMGGGQALNIGLTHLDTFSWIGAFSAGGIRKESKLVPDPQVTAKQLRLLWISCGDKDSEKWEKLKQWHDDLTAQNVPHVWHVDVGGEHVWPVWKNDLYWMSQLLFR